MSFKNTHAFTLVELIVVITILSILGTLAYISLIWYSVGARNSSRISDVKSIERVMSLLSTVETTFPLPDNPTNITYSWSLAWSQWSFWKNVLSKVGRLSNIPTDPVLWVEYSYGVSNNRTQYQLWAAVEGGLFSLTDAVIPSSYAVSSSSLNSYSLWNYLDIDILVKDEDNCALITAPSLLLSDIPPSGAILNNTSYNYSFRDSPHLPHTYSWVLDTIPSPSWFQTIEVLDSCSIDTIADLELYIAELSTAYQSFASNEKYQRLIFNSNSNGFQLETAMNLKNRGLDVHESIINSLNSPLPEEVFIDTFSASDGTNLISSHSPDSPWSWTLITWGNSGAYNIIWNSLSKTDNSHSLIYPSTNPIITSINYDISFTVLDFASGDISIYLRYIDADNYYRATISPAGYDITRRLAWSDAVLWWVVETITPGSDITFSISWDTIVLNIWGIEKENVLAGSLVNIGNPSISLQNSGASIDDYSLTYK